MKKIYLLLFVAAGINLSATAQPFQKGDKLLGGTVSFQNLNRSSNSNVSPDQSTGFSISPGLGIFTKPNRLTGFSLLYNNLQYKLPNERSKAYNYGASVYKQYWKSLTKNFYFITQGNITGTYGRQYFKSVSTDVILSDHHNYTFSVSVTPGIAYRISNHFTMDLFFDNFLSAYDTYSKYKRNYSGTLSQNYNENLIGIQAGFTRISISSFSFGFRYIL